MPYHVTITDNETGEALYDLDANAIIGSIGTEGGNQGLGLTDCSMRDLALAVFSAEEAVKAMYAGEPLMPLLVEMERMGHKQAKTEENTEN